MSSVVVVATMRPSAEHAERARTVLTELVSRVHNEEGCLRYALHAARDGALVMIEHWASKDALRAHANGEAAAWSNEQLEGCWSEPPQIVLLEPMAAGDPALGMI